MGRGTGSTGPYTGDFIEYLNAMTVFDKLGLTTIPANVTIMSQDGAASGYFVGDGKAIPMSKPDFMDVTLTPLKAAAITTVSNDLLRNASVDVEMLIRNSLAEAVAQKIDSVFLGSAAASAGVSPAGILNGVVADGSHSPDGDALRADVKMLYAHFIAAYNATGLTFVMNPSLAKAIQLMVNALGQTEFPGITAQGGTLLGDPVVTGDNVGGSQLILLKPRDIYRIGDLGIQVSVSQEATIEQSSVPTGAALTHTAASANLQNTFQQELTAIKIVRPINFAKRRSSAVSYVNDAAYGTVAST
jgi:HK97 family phage major capsid protein